ncbi:hypothetical protein ACHAP8_005868 [Fusarium lateritium]
MASLVKLPVETLQRVCHFLAHINTESLRNLCLTNKSFNQICSPWLTYQWGNSQESPDPSLEAFLMHLFRNPELRTRVKSLGIGRESAPGESSRSVLDLDSETLLELAQAAASDIEMDPEYLTPLCSDIERGSTDAVNALLLVWCTGLTHLCITVPPFSLLDGEQCHVLTFAKQAILRLLPNETPVDDLPFREVRHLEFHHFREHHDIFFEAATVFFHLPKIKSLVTSGLCDYSTNLEIWSSGTFAPFAGEYGSRYALEIPDTSSSLEELELYGAGLVRDGLSTLLLGVRNLKKLTLETSRGFGGESPDREEIANTIKICQDSLEEIDLETEPRGTLFGPDLLTLDYDVLANEMLVEEDI